MKTKCGVRWLLKKWDVPSPSAHRSHHKFYTQILNTRDDSEFQFGYLNYALKQNLSH